MNLIIDNPKARINSALAFVVWFWIVYGLCDYLSYFLNSKYDVTISLDKNMPFLPVFSFFYMLINPLLALPIFKSHDSYDCLAIYLVLAISVFIAGIIFIVFPVIPIETPINHTSQILRFADFVNLKHNMLPSLHVTLAMIVGMCCSSQLNIIGKLILWAIVFLIVLSTLLTMQHLIADVVSAIILSVICVWVFLKPTKRWLETRLIL